MAMHGDASFSLFLRQKRGEARSEFAKSIPLSTNLAHVDAGLTPQSSKTESIRYRNPGFRHFMGALGPSAEECFTFKREPFDPNNDKMTEAAGKLMAKLAYVMFREAPPEEDNLLLPSGYTYFLQLVAHDLVHSSMIVSRNKAQLSEVANVRRAPLRLETLYGGGPTECPHAYQSNDVLSRNRLRLGAIRENGNYELTKDELDIARGRAVDAQVGYPEALIADPRNDSHAILSQLAALGHRLHNAIVETIAGICAELTDDPFANAQRAFIVAQAALILIYRHYIRTDLLCRILHPAVYQAYEAQRVPLLNASIGADGEQWRVPLEFAYGFFRFAHAMIRNSYVPNDARGEYSFEIQEILKHNSESTPHAMPFERQWTIEWKHFFTADRDVRNNLSILIGPWANRRFGNALGKGLDGDLSYRDLISSIATMPWSVGALIEKIKPTHGELLNQSDLLCQTTSEQRPFESSIGCWLRDRANYEGYELSECEIDSLAFDPPIPFFVRYEAMHDCGGHHLGIVGSIVVADVFYGIFRNDKVLGIESTGPLATQLRELSLSLLGSDEVLTPWGDPKKLKSFVMGDKPSVPS